jgi:carbonic anhydrase/acetyltransferase-like protein (isoleucine patch superfamily)
MTDFPSNICPNLAGNYPEIHPSAYVHPSAQIIGNVKIGKDVFIAPLVVIRADVCGPDDLVEPIIIGESVNIQDGVIIHTHGNESVTIGPRTSIGHGVVIHGPCSIGEECFLSMRSTLYGCTLGVSVWIGMGAIVMRSIVESHTYVPAGNVIRARPDAWGLRLVTSKERNYMQEVLDVADIQRQSYVKMSST